MKRLCTYLVVGFALFCATLFIYFKVNGNKYFSIIAVYQCIAFITNYLFFTNNLIFNNYKKDNYLI